VGRQSASWTLHEAVRFDRNGITSRDWSSYPILTMPEAPHTCESNEKILNAYVLGGAAGRLVFDETNKATFRPQRAATAPIKVMVTCIPK
jgi:hypothetical protein